MGWISPTGFNDPDSQWNNESQAYDNNTGTGADSYNGTARTWGSFIELNIGAIDCDKIRFYALYNAANVNKIDIDLYYSGAWNDLYEGSYTNQTWVEKAIGSTENVTSARVRFYAKKATTAYLYEFEFNEIVAEPQQYYKEIGGNLNFKGNKNKSCKRHMKIGAF